MADTLDRQSYETLQLIRQQLTPRQQLQYDGLSPRQIHQLAAVAEERTDGADWAAQSFGWLHSVLSKYLGNNLPPSNS